MSMQCNFLHTHTKIPSYLPIKVTKANIGTCHHLAPKLGDHPDVAMALNNLAGTFVVLKKYEEGMDFYTKALAICKKVDEIVLDHLSTAVTLNNMGSAHTHQGQHAQALEHYQKALEIYVKADHPSMCLTHYAIAESYYEQDMYSEAKDGYEKALALISAKVGADDPRNDRIKEKLQACKDKLE